MDSSKVLTLTGCGMAVLQYLSTSGITFPQTKDDVMHLAISLCMVILGYFGKGVEKNG